MSSYFVLQRKAVVVNTHNSIQFSWIKLENIVAGMDRYLVLLRSTEYQLLDFREFCLYIFVEERLNAYGKNYLYDLLNGNVVRFSVVRNSS